jgi:hypothetical protein
MSGRLERWIRDLAKQAERLEVPEALEERFGRYRDDPVGFCRQVLGVTSATRRSDGTAYQFGVLTSLAQSPRVAVRSGHGVGKTAIDAWAACWWLLTRPLSRVLVLAPEYARQIRAILFSELRKWARRSAEPLPLAVHASRAVVEGFGEEWSATGMSAAGDPDRIEGFHAEGGVLVIVDECKGIPQEAFDAVQGALSGLEDSRLLVTSIPGGAGSGPFWNACVRDAARWVVHHVPATDSSLVDPQWVEDRGADWGVGSPLYETRVRGEFAEAGEGVLFPLPLLEAAVERVVVVDGLPLVGLGVDVARSVAGDLNCVAQCEGGRLRVARTWRSPDLMQTVERVLHVVAETGLQRVAVDVGGPGGGVADRLHELGHEVQAEHFGGGAVEPARFRNRRAEMFWVLREALERGTVALADDDEVRADLSALRYAFTQDGRIQVEGKDEVRRRLGRSPDRADALALALAAARPREAPFIVSYSGAPESPEDFERRREAAAFDLDRLAAAGGSWFPGDPLPLATPEEEPRGLGRFRRPPHLAPLEDDAPPQEDEP